MLKSHYQRFRSEHRGHHSYRRVLDGYIEWYCPRCGYGLRIVETGKITSYGYEIKRYEDFKGFLLPFDIPF